MKVAIEYDIPAETIANLMISAVESGDPVTNGWCAGIHLIIGPAPVGEPWYANPLLYESDFTLRILEVIDESKDCDVDTGENLESYLVTRVEFIEAFKVMDAKFKRQFGHVLSGATDATTADIFLQAMLFGEEKYA